MPYYKVPRSVQINGFDYVEADDPDDALSKAEQEDNEPCYQRAWPDHDDIEFQDPEEVTEEEFNSESNRTF